MFQSNKERIKSTINYLTSMTNRDFMNPGFSENFNLFFVELLACENYEIPFLDMTIIKYLAASFFLKS